MYRVSSCPPFAPGLPHAPEAGGRHLYFSLNTNTLHAPSAF